MFFLLEIVSKNDYDKMFIICDENTSSFLGSCITVVKEIFRVEYSGITGPNKTSDCGRIKLFYKYEEWILKYEFRSLKV